MQNLIASVLTLLLVAPFTEARPGTPQARSEHSAVSPSSMVALDTEDLHGVVIKNTRWTEIEQDTPSYVALRNGAASALTWGIVPASTVVAFDGQHAETQVSSHQPVICVCHLPGSPWTAYLVRLHAKKSYRELHGERLRVPGAEITKPSKGDLIPIEIVRKEKDAWLIRPIEPVSDGEYAVMLSAQNLAIFPFTISDTLRAPGSSAAN